MTYKSIKEINDFLKFNVTNPVKKELSSKLTMQDINDLKHSRDYLDNVFKQYTQTIRNDTYIGSICPYCNKPKDGYKILCFDCANK